MPCSPHLLDQLEARGVTQEHLEALLRFAQCGRNGNFTWHWRQGRLEHCELRMTFPGGPVVMEQVSRRVCEDPLE